MQTIRRLLVMVVVGVVLGLGTLTPVTAQDFDKGKAAYKSGDYATAMRVWRALAQQGDARAQYALGRIYRSGKSVQRDSGKAAKWFQLAAKQGDKEAQKLLGNMYYHGNGVVQDLAKARRWYKLAAEQGARGAHYLLRQMDFGNLNVGYIALENGNCAVALREFKLVAKYWKSSAAVADAHAQIGRLSRDGRCLPRNLNDAAKQSQLAAELGDLSAQFDLGFRVYGGGEGVPQDHVIGYMWLNLAAAQGHESSAKGRDIIARKMTATDIKTAQRLARECLARNYKNCGR